MKKLLVLTGRSCSGKTTFSNYLKKHYDIYEAVSFTTRDIRPNETAGIDYHFITKEEFEEKINDNKLIDYTTYRDNYYGLMPESFDPNMNNVAVVDSQGVINLTNSEFIKNNFIVKVIKVDETDEIIMERLRARKITEEEINERFEKDKIIFGDVKFNYLISSQMFLIDAIAEEEGIERK